jgi:hypothetical protein
MESASEEFIDLVRSGNLESPSPGASPEGAHAGRTDEYFSRKT